MPNLAASIRAQVQANTPGAAVVGRGKNFIEHELPSGQRRWIGLTGPGLHFGPAGDQEIDTAWTPGVSPWDWQMAKSDHKAEVHTQFDVGENVRWTHTDSGESLTLQALELAWTNSIDQLQQIAVPQAVNAVIGSGDDDNRVFWTGAYGTDLNFEWIAHPHELLKHLRIENAAALPAIVLGGTGHALELHVRFGMSSGVEVWVNGSLWTQGGGGPNPGDRDTSDPIEFRSQTTGEVLWRFNPPRSTDSAGGGVLGTFRLKKQGPNLNIFHRVPKSWLDAATYPVLVDADVNLQTAASGDDGSHTAAFAHTWVATGNSLSGMCTNHAVGPFHFQNWFRWDGVTIAGDATINTATIDLLPSQTSSEDEQRTIVAIDEDDAAASTTDAEFHTDQGLYSTETVAWDLPATTADTWITSPSIVTLVQSIVNDRVGWSSGNAFMVVMHDDAHNGADNADITMYAYDFTGNVNGAKLDVTYTAVGRIMGALAGDGGLAGPGGIAGKGGGLAG